MRRLSRDDLSRRAEAPIPQVSIDFTDPDLEIPENDRRRSRLFSQAPRWFREHWRERLRKEQGRLNEFLTSEGVRLAFTPHPAVTAVRSFRRAAATDVSITPSRHRLSRSLPNTTTVSTGSSKTRSR